MKKNHIWVKPLLAATALIASGSALGQEWRKDCRELPDHAALKDALVQAVTDHGGDSGGYDLQMWGTIVNRDGVVCAVAFSGDDRGSQWPGSRVISAQKANTANAFSLDGLSLSTANLFSAVQPGGSLFGLQHSNPVDAEKAYKGSSSKYGQSNDPMVGQKIGGVNVFGGGLALYESSGKVVGGLGLSGDTSCADHMKAWYVRNSLGLDNVTGGVSGDSARPDNIVYDIAANVNGGTGISANGWGHAVCFNTGDQQSLPAVPAVP